MYFTTTPEDNRMEALMKKPPGFVQRGGGRRRPYHFTKQDCDRHKNLFEMQRKLLRKSDNRALAALYLLTADSALWNCCKRHLDERGKLNLVAARLVALSADGYALWKAVKELQTGQRQISLCELTDREVISDRAFRLITQAAAIARFGTAALGAFSLDADEKTQI